MNANWKMHKPWVLNVKVYTYVISKVPDFTQSVQLLMLVFSEKATEPKKSFLQNPHNIFSLKYQGQVCNWNLHLKLLTNTETFCYTLLEQSLYRTEMQNFFQLLSRCLHGNRLCRHSLTSRVIWRDGPGHQDFVSLARSQSKRKKSSIYFIKILSIFFGIENLGVERCSECWK